MRPRPSQAALLLCAALTSCIVKPRDPFVTAERAIERGDLLSALQDYDAVPVSHPRYPDARAAAVAIEQRVRRCHELILEALVLRGEWRDEEALDALQRARVQWAQQPSIDRWIVATERRRRLFAMREPKREPGQSGDEAPSLLAGGAGAKPTTTEPKAVDLPHPPSLAVQAENGAVRSPQPAGPRDVVPSPPVTRPEVLPAIDEARPAVGSVVRSSAATPSVVVIGATPVGEARPIDPAGPANGPPARPAFSAARVSVGEDPVALGLISVEGRLGRAEFRNAVDDLVELARRYPTDLRVCQRLVPLLKQRALLSYGDGAVAAAIVDWRRVLELQPTDRAVAELIDRALAESGGH